MILIVVMAGNNDKSGRGEDVAGVAGIRAGAIGGKVAIEGNLDEEN